MYRRIITIPAMMLIVVSLFSSCVAKRHLVNAESNIARLQGDSARLTNRIATLENNVQQLQQNVNQLTETRNNLQQQLNATRSEASSRLQDATNQLNLSAAQLADQQKRLEYLQQLIDQQRASTQQLRKKVSDALVNFKTDELTVSVKNGKVYVSLQENLLFPSGSAVVNPKGRQALGTLAGVLNSNQDINVLIEGHTDSIPIRGRFADNWDLSTARANAIVRILTDTYKVDPVRVTASGRSYYDPVDTNATSQGRASNRRTEIILEPKLDQLMELINYDETGQAGQ